MAENVVQDIVTEVENVVTEAEQLFTPKPGGMIDRHRREQARRAEAARERENADEPVEQAAYKSVKVTSLSPEVFRAQTINIQPAGNAPVLPYNPYRSRAVIIVVTPGVSITLAQDSSAAIGNSGFQLPAGVPLVLTTRAQVYGFNNTAGIVQVSVITEIFAPETMT